MSSYLSLPHPRACIRSFVWREVFLFPYFRIMLRYEDLQGRVGWCGIPILCAEDEYVLPIQNICDREEPACKISYNMDITSCICQKVMIHQSSKLSVSVLLRVWIVLDTIKIIVQPTLLLSVFATLPSMQTTNTYARMYPNKPTLLCIESYSNSSHKRRINDLAVHKAHRIFSHEKLCEGIKNQTLAINQ